MSLGFRDQAVKQHFRLSGYETVVDDNPGPYPFTVGLALGMTPICIVMSALALWKFVSWKLMGAVAILLAIVIFQERIKEFYYSIADRIAERWYGSKAQEYFLDHQAGACFFSGMAILIISLGVLCTSQPESLLRMLFCVVGLIFGAVIAFIGAGIKSAEGG